MIALPTLRALINDPAIQPSMLQLELDAATSLFEGLTNRLWSKRTDYVVKYENLIARAPDTIYTPLYPITTIEVKAGEAADELEVMDAADLRITNASGVVRLADGASFGRYVELKITGGFDVDAGPADVRRAIMLQVQYSLQRNAASRIADVSQAMTVKEGTTGTSVFQTASMHPVFKEVAKRMRKSAVAGLF